MAETMAELNKGDLEVYSTDEKQIGVWIDKKPLYRKVIEVTSPSSANTNTTVYSGLTSDMFIVNMYGGVYVLNTAYAPLNMQLDSNDHCATWRRDSANIGMNVGSSFVNKAVKIIIEYTKS